MNSMSDIFCRVLCFVAVQKKPVGYKQQLSRSVGYAGHGLWAGLSADAWRQDKCNKSWKQRYRIKA